MVEAAMKDTSSYGTYLNGSKVGKGNVLVLNLGDQIELYRPQGESPLGMPIVYKLELHERSFAQAIEEKMDKVSEKASEKGVKASAMPVRGNGGGSGRGGSPCEPSAVKIGGTGCINRGVFPRSKTATTTTSVKGRAGHAARGVAIPAPPGQRQACPASTSSTDEKATTAPISALAGPTGKGNRRRQERMLELQDIQLKIKVVEKQMEKMTEQRRKASAMLARGRGGGAGRAADPNEPSAANISDTGRTNCGVFPRSRKATTITTIVKGRAGDAGRSVAIATPAEPRQARPATTSCADGTETAAVFSAVAGPTCGVIGASSAAVTSSGADTGAALTSAGSERSNVTLMFDQETLMKAESAKNAAVAEAAQERARARAAEKTAAEARAELQTMKADLQDQVNGLKEKTIRHEKRMADILSNKLALENEVRELRAQVAEAMETCSGLEAQLKEARDADQDLRLKLFKQEQAFVEVHQEKGKVKDKLAQRDRELLDTRTELERVEKLRESVEAEAIIKGRNLKKAERVVQDMSTSLNKQLKTLLGHLEVPTEEITVDSHGGLRGPILGEGAVGGDDVEVLEGDDVQAAAGSTSVGKVCNNDDEEIDFFGDGCLSALFENSLDDSRDAGAEKGIEKKTVDGEVEIADRKRSREREEEENASAPADSSPVMGRKKPRPARFNTGTIASLTSRRRKGGRKRKDTRKNIGRGKRALKHL